MSSSLSKRWVCVQQKTYLGFFSPNGLLILLWVMRVYIVQVKGKKVTFINLPGKEFHKVSRWNALPARYSQNQQPGMIFQLPTCAFHVALSQVSFSQASREIYLFFNSCLILHQLNTKPNTIKSHKIQETKLK